MRLLRTTVRGRRWILAAAVALLGVGGSTSAWARGEYVDVDADVPSDVYDQLERYGDWLDTEDLGLIWQPKRSYVGPDFEPFVTGGAFRPSDQGPIFIADELPGLQFPSEYGKWLNAPGLGWVWLYDTEWNNGVEFRFGNGMVAFRARPPFPIYGARDRWQVVPEEYFYDPGLRQHFVPRHRWVGFWPRFQVVPRMHFSRRVRPRHNVTVLRFGPHFRGSRRGGVRVVLGRGRDVRVERWAPARRQVRRPYRVRRHAVRWSPDTRRVIVRHQQRRRPGWRGRVVRRGVAEPAARREVYVNERRGTRRVRADQPQTTVIVNQRRNGRRIEARGPQNRMSVEERNRRVERVRAAATYRGANTKVVVKDQSNNGRRVRGEHEEQRGRSMRNNREEQRGRSMRNNREEQRGRGASTNNDDDDNRRRGNRSRADEAPGHQGGGPGRGNERGRRGH